MLVQNSLTQDSDGDHCHYYCGTLQDLNTGSAESTVACRQGVTACSNNANACTGHIAPQVVEVA